MTLIKASQSIQGNNLYDGKNYVKYKCSVWAK
jgi:hypothetical protein